MFGRSVVDADSRARQHAGHGAAGVDDQRAPAEERRAAARKLEAKRHAHAAWTIGAPIGAALAEGGLAFDAPGPAHEHGGCHAVGVGDHVQHAVQAVAEVHVGVAGRPPHGGVARGAAHARVVRRVSPGPVRFHLGDGHPHIRDHDLCAEELLGHDEGIAGVEGGGERVEHGSLGWTVGWADVVIHRMYHHRRGRVPEHRRAPRGGRLDGRPDGS